MAFAARDAGRTFVAITEHSQSLRIANGMDPDRFQRQGQAIDGLNEELEGQGEPFRVLRSMEMDVLVDGASDMPAGSLDGSDLVLGAFHSKLRTGDDQTARYVATLHNPDVQIIAHPRARMYGRRVGLQADWPRVFDEAAETGKALELDATPYRRDLASARPVGRARRVRWFSSGATPTPIRNRISPYGFATAVFAGVPQIGC
jgi:DNA polymerase (family 10)